MDTEIVIDDAFNKELDRIIEEEAKYLEDKKRDGSKYSIKKEVEIGEDFNKVLLPILKIILFKNPGLLPIINTRTSSSGGGYQIYPNAMMSNDEFNKVIEDKTYGDYKGIDSIKVKTLLVQSLKEMGMDEKYLKNEALMTKIFLLFLSSLTDIPYPYLHNAVPYVTKYLNSLILRNEYEIYKLKQQLKEQSKDSDTSIEPESDTLRDKITRIKNNKILNNRNKFYNIVGLLISEKLLDEDEYYDLDKEDIITVLYPKISKDLEKTVSGDDYIYIITTLRDLMYSSTATGRFTKKKSNTMRLRKTRKQSRK
jgi:hypothetical protein